jgi:hypothetical protein
LDVPPRLCCAGPCGGYFTERELTMEILAPYIITGFLTLIASFLGIMLKIQSDARTEINAKFETLNKNILLLKTKDDCEKDQAAIEKSMAKEFENQLLKCQQRKGRG